LVVGADTAPKGFFGPLPGERPEDPDWLRFHLLGATNPTYFALYARRRMELYGSTEKDFAAVKIKNSRHGVANPYARYRKEFSADEIAESPVVADPLRLVDICATSDGAASVVLASADYAARLSDRSRHVRIAAISTVTPKYPNTYLDMPDIATDSAVGSDVPELGFRDSIAHAAYEE
jgi:acetyl-CoA acetyltransferase